MAEFYPLQDEADGAPPIRTSIRLDAEQHADIVFFAALWNEFDRALGRKRRSKWKAASVIERLLATSIDEIWSKLGGRPATEEGREELRRKTAAELRRQAGKK